MKMKKNIKTAAGDSAKIPTKAPARNSARIIAIANQKGGVGKTTSTVNIGVGLALHGKKVLLIDLDPQANLTYSLGVTAHDLKKNIYHVLKGEARLDQIVVKDRYGCDLIPSSLDLSGADIELSTVAGREWLLKEALSKFKNAYEVVLIDCPPSLGVLTLNAFTTASEVFIALQTEYLAMQGLSKLMQTIELVKKRLNKNLEITGIIATLFDSRKRLHAEVIEKIEEYFGDKLFTTRIHHNVSLAEAPSYGQDVFTYKKDSRGAADYRALCDEILQRMGEG